MPGDGEVEGSFAEKLVALGWGILAAVLSFCFTIFMVIAFSSTSAAYHLFGDEGSAWLGISVGFPLGFIAGVAALVLVVRWRLRRKKPISQSAREF